MPGDPFRLDHLPLSPLSRAALRAARPLLERTLGLDRLRDAYRRTHPLSGRSFAARALQVLDITATLGGEPLSAVPAQGPLVVVANHPHGALDGLALLASLESVRPDFRLLANTWLRQIPEMCDQSFFVDPFAGTGAVSRSRAGLRAAHLWLRQGGALIVFPAGEVAHRMPPRGQERGAGTRIDSPWFDTVGRLALANRATVIPAFIEGGNRRWFYAAGRIHPLLRTALLPRELLQQQRRQVHVRLAAPIRHRDAAKFGARALVAAARAASDALATQKASRQMSRQTSRQAAPIVIDRDSQIAAEVESLPADSRVIQADGFSVFAAAARDIPFTLEEIGRQRERAYRAVGEGTGGQIDLDPFDGHYTHLFIWDGRQRRVAGAYRLAVVDSVVRDRGVAGLYTRRLFRYEERFVRQLGPALELGRSWVRPEYQRSYSALLLLWRGIGRFVAERTSARVLFGPVSISARYADASQALLMAFLQQNHRHDALAALVEAVHPSPLRPAPAPGSAVLPRSVAEADTLVQALEADGKGVPVLLRQYLKLNARLIGFNVDPDFGDALDALMMVDLTAVDPAVLHRYLGKETAAHFLARHRTATAA